MHHPLHSTAKTTPRPTRNCMRHGVWMAACDDCRAARAELVSGKRSASAG